MPFTAGLGARRVLIVAIVVLLGGAPALAADTPATKELANSIGMKFVPIAAGEFLMGGTPAEIAERKAQLIKRSGNDESGQVSDKEEEIALTESEAPQHRVTISKPFWLGTYEVTQAEFQAVMGFNPSVHSAKGARAKWLVGLDTQRHPVERVTWNDAVEFCRQLSSLGDEVAAGRTYRLPTEAEWEYAYRGGTTTTFFWGDERRKKTYDWTNYPKMGTATRATTVPVGSLKPNPWGLYDMPGNVREWCSDWYDAKTYTKEPVRDPSGPTSGGERVVRGGMSYLFLPSQRSATRGKNPPETTNTFIGFRVVCEQQEVPKAVATVVVPAAVEVQLKAKGIVRQGNLYVLAEETEFARFTTTLERMRMGCFNARREVDDAKKQLQRISSASAGALIARTEARDTMRYSETWREHRSAVIARNMAADALTLVNMSKADVESWLADAQADYNATLARFAEQCKILREKYEGLQAKQREVAADQALMSAIASVNSSGKANYRFGSGASASLKKLEYEESVLKKLQTP